MVEAGIPLAKSLQAIEKQVTHKLFHPVLHHIRKDVESGKRFSEALSAHPQIFSSYAVSMIYAGEQGAGLPTVLHLVSSYMEKEAQLRAKIRSVFMYPMVVGIFCLLVVSFLIVAVVPVFANVYTQLGVTLPVPTLVLMGVSQFVRSFWFIILPSIAGLIFAFIKYRSKQQVSNVSHGLLKRLPVLGHFSKKVAIAKFLRTFSSMLTCHVSVSEALDVVSKVVTHPDVSKTISEAQHNIRSGGTLTEALEKSALFSPVVIQMVMVGEESGNLGPLIEKCADAAEQEVDAAAKQAIVVLEPALTLGISFVIGFIALAIYLPMFSLMGKTDV